ncbi:MAG: SAM-dependent methyltransferase [Acidobacteria bacterium]|nr:MAG: SAM-dependent methyltransferase [Acidobacteriota bacterium]
MGHPATWAVDGRHDKDHHVGARPVSVCGDLARLHPIDPSLEVTMAVPVQPILVDEAKQGAFIQKILDDTSGTMTTLLAILGDRLGLFKDLAAHGPSTTTELANRTGIQERYAREWLGGMVTAGYLEYHPETGRFVLPPEHWEALAHESGPFFFGGVHQMQGALAQVLDQVAEAFRKGGGVKQAQYPPVFWDGLERFTAGWFENLLIQQWLPAMPDVEAKLRAGGLVADIGCGRGRALVKLAQSFPKSSCIGYDVYPPTVQQAEGNARAAGVGDRVRFEARDVAGQGLPQEFDIVCTFDVVHDAADPQGLLRSIRQGLKPDGIYICLDINCSDKLEENIGPLGALFHGFSVLYCMTTSLSQGGVGLGTVGFHELNVRKMSEEAGFSRVRRLPLENPFNNVYEIRP